ncbi:PepSY-like domain-containing protein [Flavobacterium undicola]|uniref:PepSY-like domain-containing protein n=1 Tax=Flavobacterium undicola TaxID=1932779 RepID=UPI001377D32C|nr:PepSY-like domain-containing protein [Flavobacterium undicola]MBA0883419.1 PepSY-like domain-containing protein [Flavobacterium undicola]
MKKISLIAIALSCALYSCSTDGTDSTDTSTTASLTYETTSAATLPTTISSYVAKTYTGSTISEVNLNSDGTYTIYVSTGATSKSITNINAIFKLNFTAKGLLSSSSKITPVAISDLLASIVTYINTNYVGATINSAHVKSDGSFDVLITTADKVKIRLHFSSTGEFVSAHELKANGNHRHHHSDKHTRIALADLASSITTYISANYAGSKTVVAFSEADGSIDVFIVTADGAKLNLNFTADGTFVSVSTIDAFHLREHTIITAANLPAEITAYITTNYAGATINLGHIEPDGTYEVYITTAAAAKLKLTFSATFQFVSEQTKSDFGNHTSISLTDLITAITTYINTNYPDAVINGAHKEKDGTIEVYITTTAAAHLELEFSATGTFLSVETR